MPASAVRAVSDPRLPDGSFNVAINASREIDLHHCIERAGLAVHRDRGTEVRSKEKILLCPTLQPERMMVTCDRKSVWRVQRRHVGGVPVDSRPGKRPWSRAIPLGMAARNSGAEAMRKQ